RFRIVSQKVGTRSTASLNSSRPPEKKLGTRWNASLPCEVTTYVPLNLHSCYSFLDSTLSINALVQLAAHHELPAIALTDKNNLHGAVEFAQSAAKAGIKPIIGAELERHGQRLCLYVENQKGYHNLCRILSRSRRREETDHEHLSTPPPHIGGYE